MLLYSTSYGYFVKQSKCWRATDGSSSATPRSATQIRANSSCCAGWRAVWSRKAAVDSSSPAVTGRASVRRRRRPTSTHSNTPTSRTDPSEATPVRSLTLSHNHLLRSFSHLCWNTFFFNMIWFEYFAWRIWTHTKSIFSSFDIEFNTACHPHITSPQMFDLINLF